MSTRQSSGRRYKALAVLGLALLALTGLILWAARRETRTEKRINQLLAELRASGTPVNAADLDQLFPDPPPDQDADLLYGPAFSLVTNAFPFRRNAPFISGRELPLRGTNMDDEMLDATRQFCAGTAGLLAVLPTNIPPATRFSSLWNQGFLHARPGNFIRVRALIQALGIHAVDAAEVRDAERSAVILQHAFRFTQAINYEPSLVSHMIHHACDDLIASAVARTLNRIQFTDEQLQDILRSMGDDSLDSLTNLWNAERCVGIWAFQSVKAGATPGSLVFPASPPEPFLTRLRETILRRRRAYSDTDFLHYLELIPNHLRVLQEPALAAETKCGALQMEYERLLQSEVGGAVLPNMRAYVSRHAISQATRASLRVALAIERFRLAHQGMPPAALSELVPACLEAVPRDPFDGQALRYRRLERGYVVYSVGPYGVDAGGHERTSTSQTNGWNVGITLAR